MTLRNQQGETLAVQDFVWALGSLCALHRLPFSTEFLTKQFPRPYGQVTLIPGARALGFKTKDKIIPADKLCGQVFSCLAWLKPLVSAITAPMATSSVADEKNKAPSLATFCIRVV